MGVKTPKKIIHTVDGLSSDNLEVVAKAIRDAKDPSGSRKPHFALDASVYAYKYKDRGMEMPAHIIDFAAYLAEQHDFDVSIYCDRTNYRHDSKRDSHRRAADVAKEKARLVKHRLEMMKLHGMLKYPSDGIDTTQVNAKLWDVGKQVEGLEKKIRESPLGELYIQLEEVLNNKTLGGDGGSIILKEALFQADAAIAFEAVNGTVDIIGSTDSDFQTLAGRNGIVMTEFKFSRKKKNDSSKRKKNKEKEAALHSIKLACCHWEAIEEVISVLHIRPKSKAVKKAAHPVFDGQPLRVRALVAIAIGCDANPGGVPGIGPSTMESFMLATLRNGEDMYPALLRWMGEKSKHAERELEVLSESILYEPGNCTGEGDDIDFKYLSTPEKVSRYHADFVCSEELITAEEDDVDLCVCKGIKASRPHNFLRSEGVYTCVDCDADLCRFCHLKDESNGHNVQCLSCFAGTIAHDEADEANEAGVGTDKTVDEMRGELLDANIPEARTASILDTLDLYDEYVVKKGTAIFDGIEDGIAMPLHCSNELDSLDPIVEFRFIDGGSIIHREELSEEDRRDVLSLYAACVDYSKQVGKTHVKAKGASKSSYAASPDLFVKIAEASRQRSGYRLLNRGWRGAMDGDAPSLFDASCFFARARDGNLCLCIKGQVRASFKDELYDTVVAITSESLYACQCSCKVGCTGNDRHACVHSFAKLLQIVVTMFDGFGESLLLLEFAAHLSGDEPNISSDEKGKLQHSIRTLNSCSSTKLQEDTDCSIVEMLEHYAVGTERAKVCPRPPSKKEMGPISRLGKASKPDTAAINLMDEMKRESLLDDGIFAVPLNTYGNDAANNSDIAEDSSTTITIFPSAFSEGPNWAGVAVLRDVLESKVKATACNNMATTDTVGHWAVDFRSEKSGTHTAVKKHLLRQLESEVSKQLLKLSSRTRLVLAKGKTSSISGADRSLILPSIADNETLLVPASVADSIPSDEPEKKRRRWSRRCPVPSCGLSNLECGEGSWHRVAPSETRVPKPGMKADTLESIARKSFLHAETKRRLGVKATTVTKGWRVCPKHKYEVIRKSVTVKRFKTVRRRDRNSAANEMEPEYEELEQSVTMEFQVPTDAGMKSARHPSAPDKISKGVGASRELVKRVSAIKETKETDPEISVEFNRYVEEMAKDRIPLSAMSDSVAMEIGIDNGSRFKPSTPTKKMRVLKKREKPLKTCADGSVLWQVSVWDRPPTVRLNMAAKEVKRRTGFSDMGMLLGYAAAVCNGDLDTVVERVTSLTWLEEWMLYFQFIFGKVSPRLEDVAADFDCSDTIAKEVLKDKRKKVLLARKAWPTFFSNEEDNTRRSGKWDENYGNKRIIMHDNTSAPAMNSSSADVNRIMFSQYYGGPVAKGGVWNQLCGWLGTIDLWTGAVSDSQYLPECGVFEEQNEFAKLDTKPGEEVLPFTNLTDKGYRCVIAAWRNGQFLLQPTFHRTDQKFSSKNLLTSATIASDRGANERAVRVCKYSDLIKRGLQRHSDPEVFNEYWLAWSFQANFMFRPVL